MLNPRKTLLECLVAIVVLLVLGGTSVSAADEEKTLFDDFPSEERLQELTEIAKEIIKYKPTRNSSVSLADVRRLRKLEERVKPSEYKIVWELYDEIVEERDAKKKKRSKEARDSNKNKKRDTDPTLETGRFEPEPMEEMVVVGTPFSGIPINPAEFNVDDIYYMRALRAQANQLYESENYAEAYPLLLELAKRGFKDSQSRLAYILFHGTEGVPKSNYRALGWLGAAANGRTEPIFRVLLNRHLKEVPPERRDMVDKVVAGYQDEFGYPEHVRCTTNHRFTNGRVKRVYCEFRLEQIANACQGKCWAHKVNRGGDS